MSNNGDEFSNPENLPLEKLILTVKNAGVIQKIKALDAHWVVNRPLELYEQPPSGSTQLGAVDAWKVKAEAYISDLKWLLNLQYHKFWSTILYHPQCMDSLVSFLQEANPPYMPLFECREIQKVYAEIRRLVLVVFSRLVTNKESKSQWMSKEYMGELLYYNFVFTVPIIWDICLVYGADNGKHVSRLLTSVFGIQPRYESDAVAAIAFVKEAFKFIILQVNKDYDSDEPPNLPDTFKGFGEINRPANAKTQGKLTFDMLRELVIHMLDTAMTLRLFVEVYPSAVKMLRQTNFVISIVQLYEYGVPFLYEKLEEVGDQTSISYCQVEEYIDAAREEFIELFRDVLAVHQNAIISGEGNKAAHVEEYISVMMDGLSERLLILDYNAAHPVSGDIDVLRQAYPQIDTLKTDFILQAIDSNLEETTPPSPFSNSEPIVNAYETIDNSVEQVAATIDNEIPDSIREESLISEVKDIFPDLGEGFILKCLKHYGMNAERVINSILEDNLAEPLRGLDRSLPIIDIDPLDNHFLKTGIQRLNVFDGDEFDIMTRDDVDLSRIHRGKKKSKYKDLNDVLNDKTEVKKRTDIYSKYNLVCDEEGMYSDEYDDTYDSDGVTPAPDPDDARRPFVTPRALRGQVEVEEESEEESEPAEEEKPSSSKNNLDFCVNPEEVRARREAAWNARRGRGHRPPPTPRSTDVVGKAKGQGQEKDVIANRDRKEKHKSERANHNRKQAAGWKRSRGLVPS